VRSDREAGHATVTMLLAIAISLTVFVTMVNVMLFLYARGVVRAAVDEGARAGSLADTSVGECQARAQSALDDLLGGPLGDGVAVTCALVGGEMVATGNATLTSPIPGFGAWSFTLEARAVDEPDLVTP
jgi:hypothetical protein